ncbi:MAG: hypothetical protein WC397_00225 [Candidatus Paceibacterota bacterium]|jgi:hypothetical protein
MVSLKKKLLAVLAVVVFAVFYPAVLVLILVFTSSGNFLDQLGIAIFSFLLLWYSIKLFLNDDKGTGTNYWKLLAGSFLIFILADIVGCLIFGVLSFATLISVLFLSILGILLPLAVVIGLTVGLIVLAKKANKKP